MATHNFVLMDEDSEEDPLEQVRVNVVIRNNNNIIYDGMMEILGYGERINLGHVIEEDEDGVTGLIPSNENIYLDDDILFNAVLALGQELDEDNDEPIIIHYSDGITITLSPSDFQLIYEIAIRNQQEEELLQSME